LTDIGDPERRAVVREGEVLAGKYRVEKVLGVGGMGVVVAARHIRLDTKVAIKFLLPEMLTTPSAVSRFAREARAASRITSEHVARVFDVGELETGAPYMVMEFLDGIDLQERLRRDGPLTIEQTVDFILQASVAIADAHHLGIVHRDLKPANLFCTQPSDGRFLIKVLDFGVSKAMGGDLSGSAGAMTQTGAVVGSPYYMSPEQMRGSKDVDAQADVWALGVILFELLTGKVPFDGEIFSEIVLKIATQPPVAPRELRPEIPEGLQGVILRCLEKERRHRFADVAELALALVPFGPRGADATVERISRIVQSGSSSPPVSQPPPGPEPAPVWTGSGSVTLSAAPEIAQSMQPQPSVLLTSLPEHGPFAAPAPPVPQGTMSLVGHSMTEHAGAAEHSRARRRGTAMALLGAAGVLSLGGVVLGVRVLLVGHPSTDASSAMASSPAAAYDSSPMAAAPASLTPLEQVVPAIPPPRVDPSLATADAGTVLTGGPAAITRATVPGSGRPAVSVPLARPGSPPKPNGAYDERL
jgi:eukaryotic-like serine/threonine-protein kinase